MLGRSFLLLLIAVLMSSTLLLARAAEQDDGDEYLDEEEEASPEVLDDGKVVTLTSANFESVIKENKNVLVRGLATCAARSTCRAQLVLIASRRLAVARERSSGCPDSNTCNVYALLRIS